MGVKKNFLFSTVLTVSNYIFPFIVYPYVSRVLGVNNIGICNFVDSIINYVSMISLMGISIVGVRDIAKSRKDPHQLNATFTSLFTLCTAFTVFATVVLVVCTYTIDELIPYRRLLMIGMLKLWGNYFLLEWLYRGLEDFKYITMRTIFVKALYIICVFIFIHKAGDYVTYFLLICLTVAMNAAINCFRAFSIIRLRFDWPLTLRLSRSFITLGVYMFLNSMYTTFNVIYLGFLWGDTEVGYYTTSTKLFNIILAIYTAYSGVVMPRASALLSANQIKEFKSMILKSIQGLLLISIPVVLFTMLYAPGIIYLIAGDQYGGAIPSMTVVMPLIFIIGYEQILVVQTLTPLATDRIILFNSVVGATVGVVGNLILVKYMASMGSAIVWVSAEIVVLICAQYFVKKRIGLSFPMRDLAFNIMSYTPYILISSVAINPLPVSDIPKMIIGGITCLIYFIIVQKYFLKNELYVEYSAKIVTALTKRFRK